jgi:hypothetical protein
LFGKFQAYFVTDWLWQMVWSKVFQQLTVARTSKSFF